MGTRCRRSRRCTGQFAHQRLRMGEETDAGIGAEYLVIRSGKRGGDQPAERSESHKGIASFMQLNNDGGCHTEGNNGQQLVGDAKERPERVDSAERISYSLKQEISPGADNEGAGEKDAGIPTGASQRLPDMAESLLQHEASYTRAGVEDGQDKQRLEHDGEVIPDGHQSFAAQGVREDVCHADGKCRSATGAVKECLVAYSFGESSHICGRNRKSPGGNFGGCGFGGRAYESRGAVEFAEFAGQ